MIGFRSNGAANKDKNIKVMSATLKKHAELWNDLKKLRNMHRMEQGITLCTFQTVQSQQGFSITFHGKEDECMLEFI